MATSDVKAPQRSGPASPNVTAGDSSRTKSVATRLTEAELAEVEAAASKVGKKVSEWLRDTALASVRSLAEVPTEAVLLAEIIAARDLILNLFAQASKGPLSTEDMRQISAYADSIKEEKARQILSRKRPGQAIK